MTMDLSNFWDANKLHQNKKSIRKVFFYRICGIGMGACATLLKEAGYEVEGCDSAFYPPMGAYLKQSGVKCYTMNEFQFEMLKNYDLIIVGNSVNGASEAARGIESSGTPFTSFPCLMGELILKDRQVIGIAGTHGKTTTTYYLTQMLTKLGKNPGHFVGGVLLDRPPATLGTGPYFVIESDEYDSSYFQKMAKFRQYSIDHLVLTSLEYDHADIYESVEAIEKEFAHILPNISSMIGNSDYPAVVNTANRFKTIKHTAPISFYGFKSEVGPLNIKYNDGRCSFDIAVAGKLENFVTSVIGDQNILNLTSCILFCINEGIALDLVKSAVKELKNVKRRQEYRGQYKNAVVIDDFAHHPTSVSLTIDSVAKAYPGKTIYAIVEPSTSTSRSVAFQDSFVPAFKGVEAVLVADPGIPTNATQYDDLDYEKLSYEIAQTHGIFAKTFTDLHEMRAEIDRLCEKESVLLVMGNRTIIGLWESDFVSQLSI